MNYIDFRLVAFAGTALAVVALGAAGASSTLVGAFLVVALVGVFVLGFRS